MFIENISEYVLGLVISGESVIRGRKISPVEARIGTVGEVVETIIDKTVNTVKVDEEGNPDWIITNKGGEEYIISHKVFISTYSPVSGKKGIYIKNSTQLLVSCKETVEFVPSWGGTFTVEKGGYFTVNGHNKIAGIQPNAFSQTYEIISSSEKDRTDVIDILSK